MHHRRVEARGRGGARSRGDAARRGFDARVRGVTGTVAASTAAADTVTAAAACRRLRLRARRLLELVSEGRLLVLDGAVGRVARRREREQPLLGLREDALPESHDLVVLLVGRARVDAQDAPDGELGRVLELKRLLFGRMPARDVGEGTSGNVTHLAHGILEGVRAVNHRRREHVDAVVERRIDVERHGVVIFFCCEQRLGAYDAALRTIVEGHRVVAHDDGAAARSRCIATDGRSGRVRGELRGAAAAAAAAAAPAALAARCGRAGEGCSRLRSGSLAGEELQVEIKSRVLLNDVDRRIELLAALDEAIEGQLPHVAVAVVLRRVLRGRAPARHHQRGPMHPRGQHLARRRPLHADR